MFPAGYTASQITTPLPCQQKQLYLKDHQAVLKVFKLSDPKLAVGQVRLC